MRPLSDNESRDVSRTVARLREAKQRWRRTAERFGSFTAEPIRDQIRAECRTIRRYVEASRDVGIDLMPTLRAELAQSLILVEGRNRPARIEHPSARARASRIVEMAR